MIIHTRSISLLSALALGTFFSIHAHADLGTGLVAYYPLDGNVNDASGNDYDAVPTAMSFLSGVAGMCGQFTGGSHNSFADTAAIPLGNHSLSIACWIYVDESTIGGIRQVIEHNNQIAIEIGTSGQVIWMLPDTIGRTTPTGVVSARQWTHVCTTFDSGNQVAKVFVDGALKLSSSVAPPVSIAGSRVFRLADDPDYDNQGLKGRIDDVRIYNRALADWEIAELYAGGGLPNFSTIISNVRASQRTGTNIVDIYYDLTPTTASAAVAVTVSTNNGATYDAPAGSFSGHFGAGVPKGYSRKIVWQAGNDFPGKLINQCKIRLVASTGGSTDMAYIPTGSFMMGATTNMGHESYSGETPQHTANVAAFYMDRTEVTKALWDEVRIWANTNGYDLGTIGSGKAANHPVHTVNWYDCVKWCNARSEKENLTPVYCTSSSLATVYKTDSLNIANDWVRWTASGYRLPTEAEWEKAARGGTPGHRFPWSDVDTIQHSRANYWAGGNYSYDLSYPAGSHPTFVTGGTPYTSSVGYFATNGYGLYDMAGNVWEWCWDRYSSSYYGSSPTNDPRGPTSGSYRVHRGGGWVNGAYDCRAAHRGDNAYPGSSDYNGGFRCVRSGSAVGYGSTSSAQSGTFSVDARGSVAGAITARILGGGVPLAGAQLNVDGSPVLTATSGTDGVCTIANVPAGSGYVVVASACDYGSARRTNLTVITGTLNLGDINLPAASRPYRLVALVPDVNPPVTEVEEGGTGYRYYLLAAADGKTPMTCASVSVRLSGGSTVSQVEDSSDDWAGRVAGVPDPDGIVRLRIPASVLTPVNTPRTIEVLVDGDVRKAFTAKSVPREYEQVWKHKVGVGIGGSVGVVAPLAVSGANNRAYQTEVRRTLVDGIAVSERIRRARDTEFRIGVEVTPPSVNILGAGVSYKAGVGYLGGLLRYSEYEFAPETTDPWDNGLKLYLALGDKLTTADALTLGLYDYLAGALEPYFLGDKRRVSGAEARLGVYGDASFSMGWNLGKSAMLGINAECSSELYALAGAERTFDEEGESEEFSLSLGYGSSASGSAAAGLVLGKGKAQFGALIQGFAGVDGETRGRVVFADDTAGPVRVETVDTFGIQGGIGARLTFGKYLDDPGIFNLGSGIYQEVEYATALDLASATSWHLLTNRSKAWRAVADGGAGLLLRPDIQLQLIKGYYDVAAEVNPPTYEISTYRADKVDSDLGGELLRVSIPTIGTVSLSGELAFSVERGAVDANEVGRIWKGQKRMPTTSAPKIADNMLPTQTIADLERQWVTYALEGVLKSAVEAVESLVTGGLNTVVVESATFVFDQAMTVGSKVTASFAATSTQASSSIQTARGPVIMADGPQPEEGPGIEEVLPPVGALNYACGLGGIYRFESTNAFTGTGTLAIAYSEADVIDLDEATLSIYRFNEASNRWLLVTSTVNTESNIVTATITNLGTYAVAPPLPAGDLIPLLSTTELLANGVAEMTATLTNLVLNTGGSATQHWLFTAVSDGVEILNDDYDTNLAGIQVVSTNAGFSLRLRAPLGGTVAHVSVASVAGDASGTAAINLIDNGLPGAPTALAALAGQSRIWVSWQTNAEPDVVGYRVHYRAGQDGSPFDGTAAIEGSPSPVAAVTTNVLLRGLILGTSYYVAVSAVDSAGNEGPLCPSVMVTTTEGAPQPPTGVAVRFGEDGTNVLMWALSEDDGYNDRDVARYDVWRAVLPSGLYEKIDELAPGASLYSTTNLAVQPTQYVAYAVSAVDSTARTSSTSQANRVLASGTGLDMDGDQLPDEWEVLFGLNPENPADADGDLDTDGRSNRDEFLTGKNPGVFDNIHFVGFEVLPDGNFQMSVFGQVNQMYLLEGTTNLVDWMPLKLFTCTNSPVVVVDPAAGTQARRFYRVAPLVSMPRPRLSLAVPMPAGSGPANLTLEALPGFAYRIEASTNLMDWTLLKTLTATNSMMPVTDMLSGAEYRFYRAVVE